MDLFSTGFRERYSICLWTSSQENPDFMDLVVANPDYLDIMIPIETSDRANNSEQHPFL
jgi:hypothetical protein